MRKLLTILLPLLFIFIYSSVFAFGGIAIPDSTNSCFSYCHYWCVENLYGPEQYCCIKTDSDSVFDCLLLNGNNCSDFCKNTGREHVGSQLPLIQEKIDLLREKINNFKLNMGEEKNIDEFLNGGAEAIESINTAVFYSDNDGRITLNFLPSNYLEGHDAETGRVDTYENVSLGQDAIVKTYEINRVALFFDTESLPDEANISDATLSFCGVSDFSETDFDIVVQNGQPLYPHYPLIKEDFYYNNYSGDGGSFNTVNWKYGPYNDIVMNEAGVEWINKKGITKLMLRDSNDIKGIAPIAQESVVINSSQKPDCKPKLTVTYNLIKKQEQTSDQGGNNQIQTQNSGQQQEKINTEQHHGGIIQFFRSLFDKLIELFK